LFSHSRDPASDARSPGLGKAHAGNLELLAAGDDALRACRRESGADDLDQQFDREAVRVDQQRLGAAVAAGNEQFERAAAVGLGAAAKRRHFSHPTSASDCRGAPVRISSFKLTMP
jgi:hypothetical protein